MDEDYGWFNAKEMLNSLTKAIEYCERHGDTDPYVMVHTIEADGDKPTLARVRFRVNVGDGETEYTGYCWHHLSEDPAKFPLDA